MNGLEHNQEARISFVKRSVLGVLKLMGALTECGEGGKEMQARIIEEESTGNKPGSSSKKKQLIKSLSFPILRKKIMPLFQKSAQEQFISYAELIKSKKRKNEQQTEQGSYLQQIFSKIKENDRASIEHMITSWFEHTQIKPDQGWEKWEDKILNLKHYSYLFVEILYRRVSQMSSFYLKLNENDFSHLLQVFNGIISMMDINVSMSNGGTSVAITFSLLYKILSISQRTKKESKSASFIELLSHDLGKINQKLKDQLIWVKLLSYLKRKKENRKKQCEQKEKEKGLGSIFGKGGLFSAVVGGGKKEVISLSEEQQFTCLQELTTLMANFSVPSSMALPLIKSNLPTFTETSYDYLKSIILIRKDQQQRQKIFFKKEFKERKQSEMKEAIDHKKMGILALKISAQRGWFCKDEVSLRVLCKQLKDIHYPILSNLSIPIPVKWAHFIHPPSRVTGYPSIVQEMNTNPVVLSSSELIQMDVNRSLHIHNALLAPATLTRLLTTYAYKHQNLQYCQGMNYLAGYLYIKMEGKEALAYALFDQAMQERFLQLFQNSFQIMKVKMYQFDRLLTIFHPDLSDHFKKQSISSECYIVSWMITLFSSCYQHSKECYLVDFLWERFLIYGWAQFHRFALWLLGINKEELLEGGYDGCLHILGEINKSDMLLLGKQKWMEKFGKLYGNVGQGMDGYFVTTELLYQLEKQYKFQ